MLTLQADSGSDSEFEAITSADMSATASPTAGRNLVSYRSFYRTRTPSPPSTATTLTAAAATLAATAPAPPAAAATNVKPDPDHNCALTLRENLQRVLNTVFYPPNGPQAGNANNPVPQPAANPPPPAPARPRKPFAEMLETTDPLPHIVGALAALMLLCVACATVSFCAVGMLVVPFAFIFFIPVLLIGGFFFVSITGAVGFVGACVFGWLAFFLSFIGFVIEEEQKDREKRAEAWAQRKAPR